MTSLYYKEIGQLLENAREELRLTLPQASTALHIRAHYLHALETGELVDLPGAAYTKGYLQSYAVFLHLDKDEMLRRFELLENDFPEKALFFPQVFSKEKNPSYSIVYGGVFLAMMVYAFWFLVFRPDTAPSLVAPVPLYKEGISSEFPASNYVFNLACATPKVRVYPPCYRSDVSNIEVSNPLLLRRQIISVMELAR